MLYSRKNLKSDCMRNFLLLLSLSLLSIRCFAHSADTYIYLFKARELSITKNKLGSFVRLEGMQPQSTYMSKNSQDQQCGIVATQMMLTEMNRKVKNEQLHPHPYRVFLTYDIPNSSRSLIDFGYAEPLAYGLMVAHSVKADPEQRTFLFKSTSKSEKDGLFSDHPIIAYVFSDIAPESVKLYRHISCSSRVF